MLLIQCDFNSALVKIHNYGFIRQCVNYGRIESFDSLIKFKTKMGCYYFSGKNYIQTKEDFIQLSDPKKVFNIKITEYLNGDVKITAFQGENNGNTIFLVLEGFEYESEGCSEIKFIDLLIKNGLISSFTTACMHI